MLHVTGDAIASCKCACKLIRDVQRESQVVGLRMRHMLFEQIAI